MELKQNDTAIDKRDNGKQLCLYDTATKKQTCGYTSTAPSDIYYMFDPGYIKGDSSAYVDPDCTLSNCATSNYYGMAKAKCEAQGARLANLAELEIARTNNLLKLNDTLYFASDRYNENSSYGMNSSSGNVGTMYLYFSYRGAICVGN